MKIPFMKPTLPPWKLFREAIEGFYETGYITNGPVVRQFESEVENVFQVGRAIAVSSCTSGLMLALSCLGVKGKVALPSFTFYATAHAVVWNGLEPVFIDVEPDTWNISIDSLRQAIEDDADINAVMPVHIFGNPCDVYGLEALANEHGLDLIHDSAHAMGTKVGDKCIGCFGDAEVFSLSPTKLVTAGEGGIITTGNEDLADKLLAGRDYGNNGDYNPAIIGLNARMSEFHAALAVESFRMLESNVERRNAIANKYIEGLSSLPGITFQTIRQGNRSTLKDFTVLIDEDKFGIDRDVLSWYLSREGIDTRKYYNPPVHRTAAYWEKWGKRYDDLLPVTNRLSSQALSLPIWSHMEEDTAGIVIEKIIEAHENAEKIHKEHVGTNG